MEIAFPSLASTSWSAQPVVPVAFYLHALSTLLRQFLYIINSYTKYTYIKRERERGKILVAIIYNTVNFIAGQ